MSTKSVRWSDLKSARLKQARGVSFEEILNANKVGRLEHANRPGQSLYLYEYHGYIWVVPYVETEFEIFLKTLYPSRKYTKLYREGKTWPK